MYMPRTDDSSVVHFIRIALCLLFADGKEALLKVNIAQLESVSQSIPSIKVVVTHVVQGHYIRIKYFD